MADFDLFLPMVLRFEGGFVNDPDDPGGATNKGITLKTFTGCAEKLLGIEPTLANLQSLSDAQAGAIYRSLYWNLVHGDEIASQSLAAIVCDFYVNSGSHATRLLQSTLNTLGANLVVDGAIGPSSLQALAAANQDEVYQRYKQGRIAYYQGLVQQEPSLGKFLNGWLNRVNSFPDA
ncbi:MAG TPA: glycosyl hydrolase 108 family protein [Bryobacteraceae bacterium]|nr:glycosyl hydrolase 108 family protein [Bryobacteraceae bacterium]